MSDTKFQLAINPDGEVPIYAQVKNQIRLAIDSGKLAAGKQLPSVRELALTLEINANTVSRIYSDLEREGYLARRRGVGMFAVDPHKSEKRESPGRAELKEVIRQLRGLGYSPRQILELAGEILEEEKK
jgi:GntR family transcriptional regulator